MAYVLFFPNPKNHKAMENPNITFGTIASELSEYATRLYNGNADKAHNLCKRVEAISKVHGKESASRSFYFALANNLYINEKKREARKNVQEEAQAKVREILAECGIKQA